MDFWLWAERIAVLIAGLASLIAVGIGRSAIRLARDERAARERAEASAVLSTGYLLRRRMEGWWKTRIVAKTRWPGAAAFRMWRKQTSEDVELADRLLERSTAVGLVAANHAELAVRYLDSFRHLLGEAAKAHKSESWDAHRGQIAECIEAIMIVLERLESVFPDHARRAGAVGGVDHLLQLDSEIRREAADRAGRQLADEWPAAENNPG